MRSTLKKPFALAVVAVVALFFLGFDGQRPGPNIAFAQQRIESQTAAIDHGYVIILRGLANIFSRGMDAVAKELQERGARVHLDNHRYWKELALELVKRYEADKKTAPIIIMGHSLGANAAVLMADKLAQYKVPVRLIVAFDGLSYSEGTEAPISYNVQEVLNFYNSKVLGVEMVPGRGFSGKIDNVDVQGIKDAGHMKVDKNPELQARAISLVMQALGKPSKPAKK